VKDDEVDRLIQDELDGVATPEEAARLKQRLAEAEADRGKYRDMQTVFGLLDRMDMVEPPPDLKTNVLRAVEPRILSVESKRGVWILLKSAFQRRPLFRFAYPFALGTALGALVVGLAIGRFGPTAPNRDSDLSGSMLPSTSVRGGDILDRSGLELGGARLTAETRAYPHGVAVQIEIKSTSPVDVGIRFDPAHFTPMGFRRLEPPLGLVELHRDGFWIHQSGAGRYELLLRGAGDQHIPLQVVFQSADRSTQGVLRTTPPH
jgi:anti-sigma factor RsiW